MQAHSVWDPFKPDLLPLLAVLVKAGGGQADVTPATAHSTCGGLARGSDITGSIDLFIFLLYVFELIFRTRQGHQRSARPVSCRQGGLLSRQGHQTPGRLFRPRSCTSDQ